jgi:hypothetical protein
MKLNSILAAAAVLIGAASCANASVLDTVNINFVDSTFTGTVTFADNFSSISAVNGVLTGHELFDPTLPAFSDIINTVNNPVISGFPDDITAPGIFGTYLFSANHFIIFTYDYSGAPILTFSSHGNGNIVDSFDPFVSGSISPAATPLPASWTMLLLGLAGLGFMLARPARTAAIA